MKLSLVWMFDHIQAHWKDYAINELATRLSNTTAEIDHVRKVTINAEDFSYAHMEEIKQEHAFLTSHEWKISVKLPMRKDGFCGNWYLIKKTNKTIHWATLADLGSEKDGLVPTLKANEHELHGRWKDTYESEDYILTLDNKTITHRPDLWSHRGFAREVAALYHLDLTSEDLLTASKAIKNYNTQAPATTHDPFTINIQDTQTCKRFAGLYIQSITYTASLGNIAGRLARIGARPIDAIVDATNYTMYDIGQPIHAFDAAAFPTKTVIIRRAHNEEKLKLLDGETITLTDKDCIISNEQVPCALAGIMGGISSSVNPATRSIFIEAAYFQPGLLRNTAIRHKKRTEASSRFEKGLDTNQNTQALLRFLRLLEIADIPYNAQDSIISLGSLAELQTLTVSHLYITQSLGLSLPTTTVSNVLTRLGFGVSTFVLNEKVHYKLDVPTFLCSNHLFAQEDVVEEIARFVGYDAIPLQLPHRIMSPIDTSPIQLLKIIKQHMAFGLAMNEVQNYALYDEEFIQKYKFQIGQALELKNPISEHWTRLVTSLIPHLIKNVYDNKAEHNSLRFFEWGRIWNKDLNERYVLSGIFWHKQIPLDFYDAKHSLDSLYRMLKIPVIWDKPTASLQQWWYSQQTAQILCNDTVIGYAGSVHPEILASSVQGHAFIFELDGTALLKQYRKQVTFSPLFKYQPITLDISMLVPLSTTVDQLQMYIAQADTRVHKVTLLDFFEKPEWHNQRSVTLRTTLYDDRKTLTRADINELQQRLHEAVISHGITIR
jgi:phenylalanyl-tRNA synthetase beta chain